MSKPDLSDGAAAAGVMLLVIAAVVVFLLAIIWDAYVVSKLWSWFVAAQFNLPLLTLAHAAGLGFLISTCQAHKSSKDIDWSDLLTAMFIKPLVVLVFGYFAMLCL